MFYFIRHAESTFNIARNRMRQKYGRGNYHEEPEWLKVRFDLSYSDSPISEHGVKQAEECRQTMANQKVDLVIVSPLRRTLETCHIVFRNHKDKPKIIVDPHLRQYFESTCDIGSTLIDSIKDFPQFDFSLISDPEAWYIHTIFDEQDRKVALQTLQGLQGQERHKKAIEAYYELIKHWHTKLISDLNLFELKKAPIRKQRNYIKQTYGDPSKNIAVVSHSENIKGYFEKDLSNCEVLQISLSDL